MMKATVKSTSLLMLAAVLCSSFVSLTSAQIIWTNATEADWKPFTFLFDDAAVLTCDVGNTEYWSNICNRSAYWEFWSWNVTYGVIPKKLIHTVHLNHCRFKPTCEIDCHASCTCTLQGSGLPCDGGVNDALTGYNPSTSDATSPASDNAQTPPAADSSSAIPPSPADGSSAIPPPPAGGSSAIPPPPAGGSSAIPPPPPANSAIPPPPGADKAIKSVGADAVPSSLFELCQQDTGVISCTNSDENIDLCEFNRDDFDSWSIETVLGGTTKLNLVGCKNPPCAVDCGMETCSCMNPDTGAECGGCTAGSGMGVKSVSDEPTGTTAFFSFKDAAIQCPAGASCQYDPLNFNEIIATNQDLVEDGNFGQVEFMQTGSASFLDCQVMSCEIICSNTCVCMQGEGSSLMCATPTSSQNNREVIASAPEEQNKPLPSAAADGKLWSSKVVSLVSAVMVCLLYTTM